MRNTWRTIAAAVATVVTLSACTGAPTPSDSPSGSTPGVAPVTDAGGATPGAQEPHPATTSAQPVTTGAQPVTKSAQPVPKVQRPGAPEPSIEAEPTGTDGQVSYPDGVLLRILDVSFEKETKEGPGSFPGRAYGVLNLEIANGSGATLSLDTVVVTVLDKSDVAVAPVYVEEAQVADFAGEVKPGETARARYAFALPESTRSQVTVVVDFDGVHTSAVFRGGLG